MFFRHECKRPCLGYINFIVLERIVLCSHVDLHSLEETVGFLKPIKRQTTLVTTIIMFRLLVINITFCLVLNY